MSSTYNGNSASYPTSLTLQSDGDVDNAAGRNAAIEGLADRTAYLRAAMTIKTATFTANGTWTAPAGCTRVLLIGYGGGGGGGSGYQGSVGTATAYAEGGGGGGGGALESAVPVTVTPGAAYDVVIGAGGAGGASVAGVTPASEGSDGGDTTFAPSGGAAIATFTGAQRGFKQGGSSGGLATCYMHLGGGPVRGGNSYHVHTIPEVGFGSRFVPGGGGAGASTTQAYVEPGMRNLSGGYAGGAAGSAGASSGAFYGGLGGAGGGAGPGGAGGDGGNGGAANSAGVGTAGSAGSSGAANSGAGGGGGGAGGRGSTNNVAGGTGGAGGSGKLTIVYVAEG